MPNRNDRSPYAGAKYANHKAPGENNEKKPSILDEISVSQLASGALAAVTSLLLSSQIGIAGSVIGAAAGYVVTAVSGVVYKRVLNASAEKVKQSADMIRSFSTNARDGATDATSVYLEAAGAAETRVMNGSATGAGAAARAGEAAANAHGDAADLTRPLDGTRGNAAAAPAADATVRMANPDLRGTASAGAGSADNRTVAMPRAAGAETGAVSNRAGRVAPAALRQKAAQARAEERAALQRKVTIVSVAAGLVAVAAIAAAVTLFTGGNGLGPKPHEVFTPTATQEQPESAAPEKDAKAPETPEGTEGQGDQNTDADKNGNATASGNDASASDMGDNESGNTDNNAGTDAGAGTDSSSSNGSSDASNGLVGDASGNASSGNSSDSASSDDSDATSGTGAGTSPGTGTTGGTSSSQQNANGTTPAANTVASAAQALTTPGAAQL